MVYYNIEFYSNMKQTIAISTVQFFIEHSAYANLTSKIQNLRF